MTFVIILFAVIIGGICYIVDEGSFFSKLALSAFAATIAFLLLRWITGILFMTTLAKLCATTVILSALVNIIRKIVN